ncbi:hypothetical protein [Pseudoroseomonas ludipueritiae]|uniref:Stability/partitioning determinant n=1 Tax=Pseudoroseomonas ludipueritiae TaxID=198093 RepID=A0ABR7RCK8_9PROT|nr:hypothetical protein [Pseudoroseomonas ludipueritiae]MBC9179574.1 hypothetical protein [Pseudoroseomonas ludipueritiae]
MSKQPYRPLSSIDILADVPKPAAPEVAAPAPEPKPAAPRPKEGRRQSGYRYTVETHEALRLAAFQQRRTIQDIIDEAVLLWLANKK